MKILFATFPMAFHTPGGGEIQLLKYKEELEKKGHDVKLLDQWNPNFNSFDIVHFFSCYGGSEPFCRFIKSLNIPLVITTSLWLNNDNKNYYDLGAIYNQLTQADRLITNSHKESVALSQHLNLDIDLFSHVYNAAADCFFEPFDASTKTDIDLPQKPFLLNVANIERRKNQHALIEILDHFPDYQLLLVGHIRDEEYYKLCNIVDNEKATYLGPLKPESDSLRLLYQQCDCFVLPSLLETPGIAAIEAAASGAKIAVTSEGSPEEYFGKNAVYINPNSNVDIITGIHKALNVKENARGKVDHLRWANVTTTLEKIYEDVITARHQKI